MKEVTVEITNESGLHARPATAFTQLAAKFASKLTIVANGKTADAKSILTVLTLGATKGTSVVLTADGADEDDALAALSRVLNNEPRLIRKRGNTLIIRILPLFIFPYWQSALQQL